ncbi:hypothetical protein BCW_A0006 [Bacillus cereus W]|nr:hypothetical protein BCW_A0006 [Bacillus cereus W]
MKYAQMRKEKIPHQAPSPFRLRNCWEERSVRASSLLRQNSSSVPLSLGRTRPCKTTASPVCWKDTLRFLKFEAC